MIRLDAISLTLRSPAGPVDILKAVDLEVAAGSSLSVVGPSGSGKSSLLAIIGGIEQPTSGRAFVDGEEITALDQDGLALFRRDRIGILFQSFHLIPTMTARENVALPMELAGRSGALRVAAERLAEVGLKHRLGHYPGQLSGGEQQRVAIARALINEPTLILADEPTGNLDSETGRHVIELLFDTQKKRNTTLLLITHDGAIAALCDETVRMSDGRILSPGDDALAAEGRSVAGQRR